MNTLTEYVAQNTMELKEANSCLSFITLVWRDKPILIIFNNLTNKIMSSFENLTYQVGDLVTIEKLINKFLE